MKLNRPLSRLLYVQTLCLFPSGKTSTTGSMRPDRTGDCDYAASFFGMPSGICDAEIVSDRFSEYGRFTFAALLQPAWADRAESPLVVTNTPPGTGDSQHLAASLVISTLTAISFSSAHCYRYPPSEPCIGVCHAQLPREQ